MKFMEIQILDMIMKNLFLLIALLQCLSIFNGCMSLTDPERGTLVDSSINGVSGREIKATPLYFPFEEKYECNNKNEESEANQVSNNLETLIE